MGTEINIDDLGGAITSGFRIVVEDGYNQIDITDILIDEAQKLSKKKGKKKDERNLL